MSVRSKTSPTSEPHADGRTLLALIRHMGRALDDLEKLRIQHQLRRGAFEREHEMLLPPDAVLDSLNGAEHQAELELVRLWRTYSLAPWAKSIRGVGEKSIARLIAEIGDPADRANVAKLWSYCGLNPERRRRKGMSQDEALACGNPQARKQVWLISTALLKSGVRSTENGDRYAISAAGELYLARKASTALRVEKNGEPWSDGHRHNDALRIVGKEFVKQLWIASRQFLIETQ